MSTINKQFVGSLLINPSSLSAFGSDGVNLTFFGSTDQKLIKLAYKFYEKGVRPTESNISGDLEAEGFNSKERAYAINCLQLSNNASLVETYETIAKSYKKTESVRIASEFLQKVEDGEDIDSAKSSMEEGLMNINMNMMRSEEVSIEDMGEDYLIYLRERYEKEKDLDNNAGGIPTGIKRLSLKENMQIHIGARPGNYKTATALSMARYISDSLGFGELVVVYTAEMSQNQIYGRMSSAYNKYSGMQMNDKMTIEKYNSAQEAVQQTTDRHKDTLIMKRVSYIEEIELHVKSLVMQGRPPSAIFIDYIQLLSTKNKKVMYTNNKNRVVEYVQDRITRLKRLTSVVVLAQFNREVDNQPGCEPHMGNFGNASQIEKDSDLCLGLWKPSKYGVENDKDGNPFPPGVVMLLNMKDRHGQILDHLGNPEHIMLSIDGDNMTATDYVDERDFEDVTDTFQPAQEAIEEVSNIIKPGRYDDDDAIPF